MTLARRHDDRPETSPADPTLGRHDVGHAKSLAELILALHIAAAANVSQAGARLLEREVEGQFGDERVVLVGVQGCELSRQASSAGIPHVVLAPTKLEQAIVLALKQTEELARLRVLLDRSSPVERAKGILMERHKIGHQEAYERLRSHARKNNLRLIEVAEAVADSHLLLQSDA